MALVSVMSQSNPTLVDAVSTLEGQSTAFKWYSAGCRTLEDLRHNKGGVRLNPAQLIGLQYYDGIEAVTFSYYFLKLISSWSGLRY